MSTYRCVRCGGLNRVADQEDGRRPVCGRCRAALDLSGKPQNVSDDALLGLVKSSPVPVLLDFWAPWCGPCRAVAPHLEALGGRHAGALIVAKLNTEEHQGLAGRLGVQAIPTLVVFQGGKVVARQAGALRGPELEAFVAPFLQTT